MSFRDHDRPLGSRSLALLPARPLLGFAFTASFVLVLLFAQQSRLQAAMPEAPVIRTLRTLAEEIAVPRGPSDFEKESAMSSAELIERWDPLIKSASKRFGVPEKWIRAVMRQESGGRTMLAEGVKIVSPVGAMGLMQVMPETYEEMRAEHNLGPDPFNPEDNINAGVAYLRWLKSKYGFNGMFAAYNAGPGTWERSRAGDVALPLETRNYVKSIGRMLGVAIADGAPQARRAKRERQVTPVAMARYRKMLQTIPLPAAPVISAEGYSFDKALTLATAATTP